MIPFHYKEKNRLRSGKIRLIRRNEPAEAEMEIEADGWVYHTIIGRHRDGNFICIPNWNVGGELAGLQDTFWNNERLRKHTDLKDAQINAIVSAICEMDKFLMAKKGCG